jgi:hypothetical protein
MSQDRQPLDSGDRRHLHSPLWNHARYCRFRVARECAIPVACEHNVDVCPECDPCTCTNPPRADRRRRVSQRAASGRKGGG